MVRDRIFRWGNVDDGEVDVESSVESLDQQSRTHKG